MTDVDSTGLSSDQRLTLLLADKRFRLGRIFCLCVTAAIIGWRVVDAVEAWAARTTSFDIVVGYFTGSPGGWTVSVALTVGVTASFVAYRERRLRSDKAREMGERNRRLEIMVDRRRTSSGLTPEGHTNPKDK